ncbi:MAG: hypothetical protein ACPGLV_13620 [Bacteroidia bacterium]
MVVEINSIKVFPNPVSGTVINADKAYDYEVLTLDGDLLRSVKNTLAIFLGGTSKGTYVLKTS